MPDLDALRALAARAMAGSSPGTKERQLAEGVLAALDRPGQVSDTFCSSKATRGHEKFDCLEKLLIDLSPHPGLHRGCLVPSPCEECDGLEQHTATCKRIDETNNSVDYEVCWDDDGQVTLARWEADRT